MTDIRFHVIPDGPKGARRIAYRFSPGTGPALVFLPGYMSDGQQGLRGVRLGTGTGAGGAAHGLFRLRGQRR